MVIGDSPQGNLLGGRAPPFLQEAGEHSSPLRSIFYTRKLTLWRRQGCEVIGAAPREICLAAVRRHFASKTAKFPLTYPFVTFGEHLGLVVPANIVETAGV